MAFVAIYFKGEMYKWPAAGRQFVFGRIQLQKYNSPTFLCSLDASFRFISHCEATWVHFWGFKRGWGNIYHKKKKKFTWLVEHTTEFAVKIVYQMRHKGHIKRTTIKLKICEKNLQNVKMFYSTLS